MRCVWPDNATEDHPERTLATTAISTRDGPALVDYPVSGKYLASFSLGASDVLCLHRRVDARADWKGEAWAPTLLRRLHASAARRGAVTAATGARWPSRPGYESAGPVAGALPFSAVASPALPRLLRWQAQVRLSDWRGRPPGYGLTTEQADPNRRLHRCCDGR